MRIRIPRRRGGSFPARFPSRGRGSGGRGKFRFLPILLFALFALFYLWSNKSAVPLTGRTQFVTVSRDQEVALGLQSYQQILNQSNVITSGPAYEKVKEIGQRIASVIEPEFTEGFKWEFNLIDSEQVNAFCLPGGKVAVYTGLIPVAENEDGLAVVIGHEIAHAVARHGAERMTSQKLQQWGTMAVGMSVGDMDPSVQRGVMQAFGMGSQFGILLPFSRKHESEADDMGLTFAARACFNPEEAPKLWERMAKASEGKEKPPEFMSTHPNPDTRIDNFKAWMPKALKTRSSFCKISKNKY